MPVIALIFALQSLAPLTDQFATLAKSSGGLQAGRGVSPAGRALLLQVPREATLAKVARAAWDRWTAAK
jgi:hypothetical protein